MDLTIESGQTGLRLAAHLVPPARSGVVPSCGLVLCHGFPAGPGGAATAGDTYPDFAQRLAAETGWAVLTFQFRGAGRSEGDFSLAGWLTDLRSAVAHLAAEPRVAGVWVAGSSAGGALAICAAAEDERVRGVATLAAPADFERWARDPEGLLAEARRTGVVKSAGFPADTDAWARELRDVRPLAAAAKLAPRPVLLLHGSEDEVVPVEDARALADACDGPHELRILKGGGHRLRHDPRAVAALIGWMDRQAPS
ncbi:MAG: alpha/beta hydrolase [Acidimicrobiales bacterium]